MAIKYTKTGQISSQNGFKCFKIKLSVAVVFFARTRRECKFLSLQTMF